jgi:hypothetical protein
MKRIINKKDLNELVGGDAFSDGGDRNQTSDSEIETGPVDKPFNNKSDYQKGKSPTSDKVFGRYRQNIPWFAVYSYGGSANGGGIPMYYGQISKLSEESKKITKKEFEEILEDLVKKRQTNDITDKNYNPKVSKILDSISNIDLSDEQLEELKKAIEYKKQNKIKNKNL